MSEAAKTIARESGNNFQCRVVNALRERGWATLVSPYYVDGSTDKAREIDLIAEKATSVPMWGGKRKEIRLRLHIECKYVAGTVVFWFDKKDTAKELAWIGSHTPFPKNNTHTQEHHYIKAGLEAGKLFASDGKRNEDNDPIFKALNQCLNGYINNVGHGSLLPRADGVSTHMLEYPVILFSSFDQFFRTDVATQADPSPIDTNFLMELNYAYIDSRGTSRRDYFLVDAVSFPLLDTYLRALEDEVKNAVLLVGD